MAFGTKNKRDWTAQDNATHAMSTMLAAEMRDKRVKLAAREKMAVAMGVGLVLAFLYLIVEAACF